MSVCLSRLDAVAGDAELNEKSQSDLQRLADLLCARCKEAMKEYEEKKEGEKEANVDGKYHVSIIKQFNFLVSVTLKYFSFVLGVPRII